MEVNLLGSCRLATQADVRYPQPFVAQATGAVEALKATFKQLEDDLKTMLTYYGEDPASTKPEDLFDLLATFQISLQVRANDASKSGMLRSKFISVPIFYSERLARCASRRNWRHPI